MTLHPRPRGCVRTVIGTQASGPSIYTRQPHFLPLQTYASQNSTHPFLCGTHSPIFYSMSFFFFVTHTPVHQSDLTTQDPHLENPWPAPCLGFPRAASVSLLLTGTNHIPTSNPPPAASQACPRISLSPLNRCPPPSWLWWWDRLVPCFSTGQ